MIYLKINIYQFINVLKYNTCINVNDNFKVIAYMM